MNNKEYKLMIVEWNKFCSEAEVSNDIESYLFEINKELRDDEILEEGFAGKLLSVLQGGFDIMGFIPILGEGFDALNAVISLSRGRPFEALCAILSFYPVLGDVIGKGGKYAFKFLGKKKLEAIYNGQITKLSQIGDGLVDDSENEEDSDPFDNLSADEKQKKKKVKKPGRIFRLVMGALYETKNDWWPDIVAILDCIIADEKGKVLINLIEKSKLSKKMPSIPGPLKNKVGNVIKKKIKKRNPEEMKRKLTNLVAFIDDCYNSNKKFYKLMKKGGSKEARIF